MRIKNQAIIGMWVGFICQFCAGLAIGRGGDIAWQWWMLLVLSLPVFTFGCMRWCQHLGYPMLLGLLGIFSFCGFLVIMVLPNRANPKEDLYLDE